MWGQRCQISTEPSLLQSSLLLDPLTPTLSQVFLLEPIGPLWALPQFTVLSLHAWLLNQCIYFTLSI